MILHNLDQSLVVKVTSLNPRSKLAMPDKSMASKLLVVVDGEIGVLVSRAKSELATPWLDRLPLHGILGSDGTKLRWTFDDVLRAGVASEGEGCADMLLSFGFDGAIEALRSVENCLLG
jgi:hypothetical protein